MALLHAGPLHSGWRSDEDSRTEALGASNAAIQDGSFARAGGTGGGDHRAMLLDNSNSRQALVLSVVCRCPESQGPQGLIHALVDAALKRGLRRSEDQVIHPHLEEVFKTSRHGDVLCAVQLAGDVLLDEEVLGSDPVDDGFDEGLTVRTESQTLTNARCARALGPGDHFCGDDLLAELLKVS